VVARSNHIGNRSDHPAGFERQGSNGSITERRPSQVVDVVVRSDSCVSRLR
jgi:hypothetical protein